MFKPVTREQTRLRMCLDGPAGSGKTYTALRLAFALAGPTGRVAVIDTEHGSAAKYEGENPDKTRPWKWHGEDLQHFAPSTYEQVIKEAGRQRFDVLVIDSLSHAWTGTGGALDQVDRAAAQSKSGNTFTAWREVTPQHNAMVEAILQSDCHVIVTLRSEMDYVMEEDEKGKKVPKKIGMKPVQRKGIEYEFDIIGDLDIDHRMTISKSRCPAVDGKLVSRPDALFMEPIREWLFSGAPRTAPTIAEPVRLAPGTPTNGHAQPHQVDAIKRLWMELKREPAALKAAIQKKGFTRLADLPFKDAEELISALKYRVTQGQAAERF